MSVLCLLGCASEEESFHKLSPVAQLYMLSSIQNGFSTSPNDKVLNERYVNKLIKCSKCDSNCHTNAIYSKKAFNGFAGRLIYAVHDTTGMIYNVNPILNRVEALGDSLIFYTFKTESSNTHERLAYNFSDITVTTYDERDIPAKKTRFPFPKATDILWVVGLFVIILKYGIILKHRQKKNP
jgi:hypothetical protein